MLSNTASTVTFASCLIKQTGSVEANDAVNLKAASIVTSHLSLVSSSRVTVDDAVNLSAAFIVTSLCLSCHQVDDSAGVGLIWQFSEAGLHK